MITTLPFDKSYWIIPGKLLAGQYPRDKQQLSNLLDSGIKTFINLTQEGEIAKDGAEMYNYAPTLSEYGATMYRMSIQDASIPSKELMEKVMAIIDVSLAENKPVYFHCWGGAGRTGTVTGCYLVHSKMATSNNVFDLIDHIKRTTPYKDKPSPGGESQRQFVQNFR
ncbi:MAG: dual specificity protein phosphatase family protein [Bacteroidales bacterium]|jgi:protein-tyrosine phosphatase|nr:dual specificity protein phosphatase family protein [Bacteroidales bacterium]